MEFDSLSGYSGATAMPIGIPAAAQPRNNEGADTTQSGSAEAVAETLQQEYKVDLRTNENNIEKYVRDRQEQDDSQSALAKAIESANKKLAGTNYGFEYSVHERTRLVMIKVVNSETNETIREVPPKKHLDAIAKMWEMAGILVDEKR